MSYRLSLADPLPDTVRACAREQLLGAVRELEEGGGDPVRAVHQARKSLKKARALLRLVRPAMSSAAYRAENGALRDAADALSATRDADVLVATVDALAQSASGRLPAAHFAALRTALEAEAEAARATGGAGGDGAAGSTPAAVAQELRGALARVDAWPLDRADWETAVAGLSRAYARGIDARKEAEAAPTVEHLHAWRKRAKDLWYHHRLLKPVWPAVTAAYGEEAHVLTELLGDDHDLAVLRMRLERGVTLPAGAAADLEPLLALIAARRAELQTQASRLAARLYAERPKAFERRIAAWVEEAVAEAGRAEAGQGGR